MSAVVHTLWQSHLLMYPLAILETLLRPLLLATWIWLLLGSVYLALDMLSLLLLLKSYP
jgi:hypothetical protein